MLEGNEKVCVQGITGKYGKFHTKKMKDYGTNIVCGVSPTKTASEVHGVKVYCDMQSAVNETGADTTILFVPAKFVLSATMDAINSGIKKIIIISEHVPQHDSLKIIKKMREINQNYCNNKITIIGPNCPGIIIPDVIKIGIMPESAFKSGDIAIISRSGTLMYEVAKHLSTKSTGVKIAMGLGGDPIIGTNIAEAMDYVIKKNIRKVAIIGEVGGNDEISGIKKALSMNYNGNVQTFFAGRTAPKGKTMGHAGAIIKGFEETIEHKEQILNEMGIKTIKKIDDLFVRT